VVWDGTELPGNPDAVDPDGVCKEGLLVLFEWLGGDRVPCGRASRFVERLIISFP
jgi:hypothetical protein